MTDKSYARRRTEALGGAGTSTYRRGPYRATEARTRDSAKSVSQKYEFEHSRVFLEFGPAGTIARIVRDSGRVEYAGPLPEATIGALAEVSR